ncbi:hypothetical protein dsx2_2872 [Desulfovibrio sp. X2]|uniref:class I SAM-dependent methyltransferase n=1 Tax=Desulfovibrio sp. X2 TaxID=941449 RepID=UPI000358A866|nr:class I SAM-dependent methyltransferase [Desulfovibrio sp. X2]EPR42148.1 hypothetical protein dsx2_2872 [Desulfovibrio sp. X2]
MADQAREGLLSPYLCRRRLAAARPHLRGHVLDFGCGGGSLARFVPPERYTGVDVDAESLRKARANYPAHVFFPEAPPPDKRFDTIVMLAVIEHLDDPAATLRDLAQRMTDDPAARLILTTPHPATGLVHTLGASVGLFSRHASEEHDELLGRRALRSLGAAAGLRLASYGRFLCGANQLAVFSRLRN